MSSWEKQLETDFEPRPGDWVLELVEQIPGYDVYDVNNGVGRIIGHAPALAAIKDRNPEQRPIYFHEKNGSYREWQD